MKKQEIENKLDKLSAHMRKHPNDYMAVLAILKYNEKLAERNKRDILNYNFKYINACKKKERGCTT